jgi:hypothetical protein
MLNTVSSRQQACTLARGDMADSRLILIWECRPKSISRRWIILSREDNARVHTEKRFSLFIRRALLRRTETSGSRDWRRMFRKLGNDVRVTLHILWWRAGTTAQRLRHAAAADDCPMWLLVISSRPRHWSGSINTGPMCLTIQAPRPRRRRRSCPQQDNACLEPRMRRGSARAISKQSEMGSEADSEVKTVSSYLKKQNLLQFFVILSKTFSATNRLKRSTLELNHLGIPLSCTRLNLISTTSSSAWQSVFSRHRSFPDAYEPPVHGEHFRMLNADAFWFITSSPSYADRSSL